MTQTVCVLVVSGCVQYMWCAMSCDLGPATGERGAGRDSDSVCISSEWLCSSVCGVLCQVIRSLRQGRGGLVVTQTVCVLVVSVCVQVYVVCCVR